MKEQDIFKYFAKAEGEWSVTLINNDKYLEKRIVAKRKDPHQVASFISINETPYRLETSFCKRDGEFVNIKLDISDNLSA